MNAEAILTPGGIADQLGGSLSGVAMALQRRSEQNRQMQMQDQQMQQQMQQQEFQNRHMLRREDRQDRRDSAADALGQRQMTLQEHIQSRLEEAGRARAQSDTSRETENRRQFDVGQGIMSPAGEQERVSAAGALAQTESVGGTPSGVFGPPPDASAALSQDDQAAMRNREIRTAKAAPAGSWRMTPEQQMSENEKDRAAADGRADASIQSREQNLALKEWGVERKAAMMRIDTASMMNGGDENTRLRMVRDWEKAHPKPTGAPAPAGQPATVDQNARRKAAWDSTP